MATIKKDGNFMGLPMNIARGNPIPLDKSSVWYSYEEMKEYAANGSVSYVGQILSLVDEQKKETKAYIILNELGDLQEIGKIENKINLQGDNASIQIIEETISLQNWGIQYYKYIEAEGEEGQEGYQPSHYVLQKVDKDHPWIPGLEPRVVADDNNNLVLAWYEPNSSTVEGLEGNMAALQTSVNNLQSSLSKVYTKTETDQKIEEKIASLSHLKRKIINNLNEINLAEEDADLYIYMLQSPNGENDNYDEYIVISTFNENGAEVKSIEKIGAWNTPLDDYVTKTQLQNSLDEKVDKIEGLSLIPIQDLEKLSSIEQGAQKNLITSVSNSFTLINGNLGLKALLVQDIANLQTILDNKVEKEEGKGLSSNDFTNEFKNTIINNNATVQGLVTVVNNLNDLLNVSIEENGAVVSGVISNITQDIKNLNSLLEGHENRLTNLEQLTQTHIGSLQEINSKVNDIQLTLNNLNNIYVTKDLFQATVGDITQLQTMSSTLHEQVKELQEALTWTELII